jgi:long-subunit fatty acid transport protein
MFPFFARSIYTRSDILPTIGAVWTMNAKRFPTYFLFLGTLLLASHVRAQAGAPTIVQFSFSNPGARSLGFGGAFVALADDATAAFANPAGLVQISRPEVSVDGRLWNFSTPFPEGGRISGSPTGILLDASAGLRTGFSSESTSGLSFLSFVYPKGNWRLAFFRHQPAKFRATTETQGMFSDAIESDPVFRASSTREGTTYRIPDLRTSFNLEMVTYGFAGSYRPTETLSIGAGLAYFKGNFTSGAGLFAAVEPSLPEGTFGPNAYVEEVRVESSEMNTIDDSDWGLTVGFLWKVTGQWSAGGFYRQGPELGTEAIDTSGPFLEPDLPDGTVLSSGPTPIGFPDVYGLGIAYKSPNGALTVSFEWDRVQYSTVLESMDEDVVDVEDLKMDDGDELHLGLEYVFINSTPVVALRTGVWKDPDHQFNYVGDDPIIQALLRPGKDQVHFALGFGLAFEKFQFDLGVDLSDLVDTASFSVIFSF